MHQFAPETGGRGAAFVTGAGRRIGAAFARFLAQQGWFVALHCRDSITEAEAVLAGIRAAGGDGCIAVADLADPAAAIGAFEVAGAAAVAAARGPITLLVNNASRFIYDDAAGMTAADWQAHMAVNLETPAFLAQRMMALLARDAQATVVNILDQKLTNLNPDYYSYTIAKAGLEAVTRMLAMSYGGRLQAAGIAPGLTLPSPKQTEVSFARAHKDTPLGRSSTVADLVAALAFILDTPAFTGQILVVDGGESLVHRPRDVALDPRLIR